MELFFKLEAGYLGIGLFVLVITLIVTTRPFVAKGIWKKSLAIVSIIMGFFIGLHYIVTTNRIYEVEKTFNDNQKVICENRAIRKVSQSVIIEKSNEWVLDNHMLSSPNYNREFFTARCIKQIPLKIEVK
jgi:energy-coupling factor transporter transmembrane protein EcfT